MVPLGVLVAGTSAILSTYAILGLPAPDGLELLASSALGVFTIRWMMADARARRCTPCYDFGYLMGAILPVSLIWYALWTRGRRGAWTLLLLVALYAVPPYLMYLLLAFAM